MITLSLEKIAQILQAKIVTNSNIEHLTINNISTDSRNIPAKTLFFALRGEVYDAHDFIDQVVALGAIAAVVERKLDTSFCQLVVNDTKQALGQLAKWLRQQMPARFVALTGSSGKTSVKEMTAKILSLCGKTLYTEGNFNNDIGVPLTLLRLTPEYRYAVIELGANHIGEIAYTANLVKPEVALINNILAAHIEGFGSIDGVAQAKGEIFSALPVNGIAVINEESNAYSQWQSVLTDKNVIRFSVHSSTHIDFYATDIKLDAKGTYFKLHTPLESIEIMLPLLGIHNIANALAASALAVSVGASLSAIKTALMQLEPVKGRLFPISLSSQHLILDDTYNANVGSMIAAANVLAMMENYRIMVVGDIEELGDNARVYHQQVGEAIHQLPIDKVLSVGKLSCAISAASGVGEHYADKSQLVKRLLELMKQHTKSTILVKGSRSSTMEQVIQQLQANMM